MGCHPVLCTVPNLWGVLVMFPLCLQQDICERVVEKGYIPADEGTANVLAERGIMVTTPGTTSVALLEQTPNATLKD